MPSSLRVPDIALALKNRTIPAITTWNRLEGRPRTLAFDRALQAEVRDALWMLTKQWQMGEFRGSDAGSPVFSKLLMQTTRLTKYQPAAGPVELFDASLPLETKVERRPVPLHRQKRILSLDIRLVMGRQWLALIADLPNDYRGDYITAYPVAKPDPKDATNVDVCSHPEAYDTFQALTGRAMDGGEFYEYLSADASHNAYDDVATIDPGDHGPLTDRAKRFMAWAKRFVSQPDTTDDAWVPDKLEYQFAASAPLPDGSEKVYVADEYYSGRLDWYSLDEDVSIKALEAVDGSEKTGLDPDAPFTTIPVPVSFSGMPNTRWWSFEERKTNFGDIDAATSDMSKLLFIEFALVYANDWFVIPCTLPSGTLAKLQGFAVTSVFGERFWIEAASQGNEADSTRWSMFTINLRNAPAGSAADTTLLVLPTLAKSQSSPVLEEVLLLRDEVANMVWGVEKTVPLPTGAGRRGNEVAAQTIRFLQNLAAGGPAPVVPAMAAPVRYQVMNTVPDNWIPFIPVHVPDNNRLIRLQRAAMPRILVGAPTGEKVQPQTVLLREGLEFPTPSTYFIHEEEVPRAGARLTQYYERTRWTSGQALTWFRAQKQTGRGEGSSGLGFDRLTDKNGRES